VKTILWVYLVINILVVGVRLALLGMNDYPRRSTHSRADDALAAIIGIGMAIWIGFYL
jgi:hypothetical protein